MTILTLTFWPWECCVYSASDVRPTYQYLLSYDYRLLSYEYWISDHISVIWNRQTHRRVTWPLTGGKNSPHFWIPDPNLPIHFVTFTALRRRLYHVIGKKLRFFIMKATKFTAHAQYHVTVHRRSPKPHVTIFWPRIAYLLYNFYGATMTIKGSLYWSIPMLKRFSAAKKLSPVKIGPRNGGFSEI